MTFIQRNWRQSRNEVVLINLTDDFADVEQTIAWSGLSSGIFRNAIPCGLDMQNKKEKKHINYYQNKVYNRMCSERDLIPSKSHLSAMTDCWFIFEIKEWIVYVFLAKIHFSKKTKSWKKPHKTSNMVFYLYQSYTPPLSSMKFIFV